MASSRLRERRLLPSRVGANDTLFPCMSGCMYVCVHGWLSMSVCVRLFSLYSARASVCVRLLVFPLLCAGDFKRCMAFNCRSMQCRLFFYFIYISLSLSVLSSLFSLSSLLSLLSLSVSLLSIRPTALKGEHTDLHFVHPVPLKFGASAPSTKSPLRAGVARSICFLVFEAELSKSGGMDTSDSIDLLGLPPRA